MPLNPKQSAFVREYLKSRNATKAAEAAGYSAKTAKQQGSRLLTVADVASAVKKGLEKHLEAVGATAAECFNVIATEMRDAEESKDRIKAAEVLLKLQHKVSEKVEHSGSVSIAVVNPYAKGPSGV